MRASTTSRTRLARWTWRWRCRTRSDSAATTRRSCCGRSATTPEPDPGPDRPSGPVQLPRNWRTLQHRYSTRIYGPSPRTTWLTWIGDERIAVGNLPTAASIIRLPGEGVTHVVNCRARLQTVVSQDLSLEKALFGPSRVAHAPMWDNGRRQPPELWAGAARFAADALDDPDARVLIHCQQGRRRSVLVAYAALRLRGHPSEDAARLILTHRREGRLVPEYRASVEDWLVAGARVPG